MKIKQKIIEVRYKTVYQIVRNLVKPYLRSLKYKWDKPRHFPKPTVVLANHNTDYDPVLVSVAFKDQMFFLASENCFRKGNFSKFLVWGFNPISKIKGASDTLAVMKAIRCLKEGNNVCIFPEGGRSFTGITNEEVKNEDEVYSLSDNTMIEIMVMASKDERLLLTSKWKSLENIVSHPTWGKYAASLVDGRPCVVSKQVLVIEYELNSQVKKVNNKALQEGFESLVEKMLGRKVFVYALNRGDSIRLSKLFASLRQIEKLPKPSTIHIELPVTLPEIKEN